MNSKRMFAALCVAVLLFAAGAAAQEKSPPPPPAPREMESAAVTPLKITVVFSEYEGEKKVSSLPYVLNHNATRERSRTSLRMGLRVPLMVGSGGQIQYHDVGTDIDCLVQQREGTFALHLELRRSSVYAPEAERSASPTGSIAGITGNPVIRSFSGGVDALLRDGQTVQSTMATDPVSGRVLRVDVTLNVIK